MSDKGTAWRTIQEVMEDWLEPEEARNMRLALLEEAGCVIVPREPTEKMAVAGWEGFTYLDSTEDIWRAMIDEALK